MFYISGLTNMVYPGAVHSRFEHSLGVHWLAGVSIEKIAKYQVQYFLFHIFYQYKWYFEYFDGFLWTHMVLVGHGAWH